MVLTPLLLAIDAILVAASLPMIFGKVPPNRFYGFRTPRTLADPRVWYPANRFAGWALSLAGVASALLLLYVPLPPGIDEAVWAIWPLVVAVIACFVYVRRIDGR
jgi:uncharacterized membrane protein